MEDYVVKPADLLVTKTDGKTTANSPGPIVYTLTVSNVGIGLATGVTLVDTLGVNLSYSSSTCGTPSGSNPIPGTLRISLPAGATAAR